MLHLYFNSINNYLFIITCLLFFTENICTILKSGYAPNLNCEFPPIDFEAQRIDRIGDYEKGKICELPRPAEMCKSAGKADKVCRHIAYAVRGVSNISCSHRHVCKFFVKYPVQKIEPGFAYVSLCLPPFAGVIFPCRQNNLIVINPTFRPIPDEAPPITKPFCGEIAECSVVDSSIKPYVYQTDKVIVNNGGKTLRGQFPWQVSLYVGSIFFCGGSIISRQHILTAAHCFHDNLDLTYTAITGDFLNNIKDDFEQHFVFYINQVFSHRRYNKFGGGYDIALIKLNEVIRFDKYSQPICLPTPDLEYTAGFPCAIAGWGHTSNSDYSLLPTELQAGKVPTIEHERCKRPEIYDGRFNEETMCCAGFFQKGRPDSCKGDSGGPLVCELKDNSNNIKLVQIGIVSWGDSCGLKNKPGVYTNVIKLRSWIDEMCSVTTQENRNLIDIRQKV